MKFKKIKKKQKNFNKIRKEIFLFIVKNINKTIFDVLGYNFFKIYFDINFNNNYIVFNKSEIVGLVSYISPKKINLLKKKAIFFILKNPFLLFRIIPRLYIFFKTKKNPHNYLQLLHLILNKSILKNTSKKDRDQKINYLHKKITINRYSGIFACYSRDNYAAEKYYKKNKYIIFDQNVFFKFVKKKLN